MPCLRAWLPSVALLAWICAPTGLMTARTAIAADSTATDEPQAAHDGILVLRTGAVISGRILKSASIYEVQSPTGKMSVPETLVKMRCADLVEAYDRLRVSAESQNDADGHVLLAQWCLANHLDNQARDELQAALKHEPDRDDVKRLLRNVEDTLKAATAPPRSAPHVDPVRTARIAAAADNSVSLGGLSRENAAQFARRIQPLLVSNCTAAGCHGRDSTTAFKLTRVTPGKDTNRHAAERNLAAALEQIDPRKPRASPLLTAPRGKHGRRGRPVFAGPHGEEQLADLRNWVIAVCKEPAVREKLAKSADDKQTKDSNPGSILQASARETDRGDEEEPGRGRQQGRLPSPKIPTAMDKLSLPQRPLPTGRGDPFDPAAFNRASRPRQ